MSDLGASSPLTCELRGSCLFLGAACWVHATQEIFLRDQRCNRSPPGRVFDDFADLVYGRRRLLRPATWLTTRSASLRHAFRYRCRPCRLFPWLIRYEGLDARLKLIERLSEWLVCRVFFFLCFGRKFLFGQSIRGFMKLAEGPVRERTWLRQQEVARPAEPNHRCQLPDSPTLGSSPWKGRRRARSIRRNPGNFNDGASAKPDSKEV